MGEELSRGSINSRSPEVPRNTSPLEAHRAPQILHRPEYVGADSTWQSQSPSFDTPGSMQVSYSDGTSYCPDDEHHVQMDMSPESLASLPQAGFHPHGGYSEQSGLTPQSISEQTLMTSLSPTRSRHTEDAAAELLALRYLPAESSQRHSMPGLPARSEMPSPLEMISGLQDHTVLEQNIFDKHDGIFLPGSAYQELHSTLRDHLIYTARSNAPTRYGTPELPQPDMSFFERGPPKTLSDGDNDRTQSDPESRRSSRPPDISPQRAYVLWKTWLDEVAPVRTITLHKSTPSILFPFHMLLRHALDLLPTFSLIARFLSYFSNHH